MNTPKYPHIPVGTSKEDVYIRRAIIVERLAPLIGTSVPCPAFNGRQVEFIFMSIDETATRAAQRYESTLAALQVVKALKKAQWVGKHPTHSGKQRKMKFKQIHELTAILPDIGQVKIIVGERMNKRILHYCITKKI